MTVAPVGPAPVTSAAPQKTDLVAAVAPHLLAGEDVVRCAAASALGATCAPEAAPHLVAALLDEDPDVRADAMTGLASCARREDAEAIRRSLQGDPVKEVKIAAIEALARLADPAGEPLVRALAISRADNAADDVAQNAGEDAAEDAPERAVAWEDEAGLWDDWLDVQVVAIEALGRMGDRAAIDVLLAARADEMGQELDTAVFKALVAIPGGAATVLGFVRDPEPKVRERAAAALAAAEREMVAPLVDLLLDDPSPALRRLGVAVADPAAPALAATLREMALADLDPPTRVAAMRRLPAPDEAILRTAIASPHEGVAAAALQIWAERGVGADEDLRANAEGWLATAGAPLAIASAKLLASAPPAHALRAWSAAAQDASRPLEARVEATRLLGGLLGGLLNGASDAAVMAEALAALRVLMVDRARQVRLAALSALAANPSVREATALLTAAMLGRIAPPRERDGDAGGDDPADADAPSFAASKVEDGGGRRIRITDDGEIVELDPDAPAPAAAPASTLDAIQFDPSQRDGAAAAAGAAGPSRKKRVAVEGPDEIADDLSRAAIRVGAAHPSGDVAGALCEAAQAADRSIAAAALEALAQRAELAAPQGAAGGAAGGAALGAAELDALARALGDKDAAMRGFAARGLGAALRGGASPVYAAALSGRLADEDAIVRAAAVAALAPSDPDKAVAAISDPVKAVRDSALEAVLASGEARLSEALSRALEADRVDVLAAACRRAPAARAQMAALCASAPPEAARPAEKARLRRALMALAEGVAEGRAGPTAEGTAG